MRSAPESITLLIATRNLHKVEEIRAVLGNGFHCLTLNEIPNPPKVIEDASTFAGNATKKAVELAHWIVEFASTEFSIGRTAYVLADDSGLEVDALNGAPGVHSARFAALDSGGGENSSDADNNAKLLRLLEGIPVEKRTARFRCVLALTPILLAQTENASPVCFSDEAEIQTQLFEGTCEGRIDFAPRGNGGFGYDPLFIPNGFENSFAELGETVKNQLSHRAKALSAMKAALMG